jgi:Fe-S-cluster containining protein
VNPACELCRGACCETFALDLRSVALPPDAMRWLTLHGRKSPIGWEVQQPCSALRAGKCSIYHDRPQVCRSFAPGCDACRYCVESRRPAQAAAILALLT